MIKIIVCLFAVIVSSSIAQETIIVDSTSNTHIIVREKYGPVIYIDSVTYVVEKNGLFYVTRNKELYAILPVSNYGIIRK